MTLSKEHQTYLKQQEKKIDLFAWIVFTVSVITNVVIVLTLTALLFSKH